MFLKSKLNVRSLPKKLFLKVLTKVLSEIFLISVEMGAVKLKLKLDVWWRGVRCEEGRRLVEVEAGSRVEFSHFDTNVH